MKYLNNHTFGLPLALSAALLSACSSGGSDDSDTTMTEVNGSVFASYVAGASVIVKDSAGNQLAGPVTTGSDGSFSLPIAPEHLGSTLMFTATGGQFIDESTGTAVNNGSLSGVIAADVLGGTTRLSLTPSSSIIHTLMTEHNLSLEQAKSNFEAAFGYSLDETIMPVDATDTNDDATPEQLLAGLRAAAFSQLTNELGLDPADQSMLLAKLAADIADGNLDGLDGENVELSLEGVTLGANIQSKFTQAFVNFYKDPALNQTGLSNGQIGHFPLASVALSDSYQVTYVPGMMDPMEGTSSFKIKIADLDGVPQTGLMPMLMPMMNMAAGHMHSTPKGNFVEDPEEIGTYTAAIYYLMASKMAGGISMGYWDLTIKLGEEDVHFFPSVMMAMGDTPKVVLKDQSNTIADMTSGEVPRSYYLFNQDLSESGENHSFSVYLATKESMMSFPGLTEGDILNEEESSELTLSSILVEMTTDPSDSESWVTAVSDANNIWTADGLSGLTAEIEGTIYVRLTINGEQATDDGLAPDEIADEAMFTVTPSVGDVMPMPMM